MVRKQTATASRYGRYGYQPDEDLDFDQWARDGTVARELIESLPWILGDWLIYGEQHFPDRYQRALEATDYVYDTLTRFAQVARAFPPGERQRFGCKNQRDLSWSHYRAVLPLNPIDRELWLANAHEHGWSVRQMVQHCHPNQLRQGPKLRLHTATGGDPVLELLKDGPQQALALVATGTGGSWEQDVALPGNDRRLRVTVAVLTATPGEHT